MDSSPLLRSFEAPQLTEYPFPVVDPVEPPSPPSDSLPSTSHTKSHRSDATSRHHRKHDRDRDQDFSSASARLLARLASRDDRDAKHARTLLVLTTERLESETRRADQAEQRVIDTLHRLRAAHEATTAARGDTARANETIQLYRLQLDYAQREINRAQEILNQVEQERAEAEAEAARARGTARRLREDNLITKAREQGRQEGYQEGLSAGRNMTVGEGRFSPNRTRRLPSRPTVEDDEDGENIADESPVRSRTPQQRRSSTVFRISPPQSTYAPRPRLPVNYQVRQSPVTPARVSARVPDVALHAPTLPVPTTTTPLGLPSPSHASPSPNPTPAPESTARYSRTSPRPPSRTEQQRMEPVDRAPTPLRQAPPSPSHPPYDILPDNYIPLANDSREIIMPPPHELSRPVTPATPDASLPETILPVAPPSQDTLVRAPSVLSRDFAYRNRTNPSLSESFRPRGPPGTMSPQSRTSTRISEFDILGPARTRAAGAKSVQNTLYSYEPGQSSSTLSLAGRAPVRMRTPGPSAVERPPSPRGPRTHSDPLVSSAPLDGRHDTEERRWTSSDNRGPLVQLFKKRFRSRNSPPDTGSASTGRAVPDITVESPSTPASQSSEQTTNAPHLLSPDYANRPLPTPEPAVTMRQEPEPPLPIQNPEILNVLPPGFIPIPTPSERRNRRPNGPSRPTTPYAEAPISDDIHYPVPPARSRTPSAIEDLYGAASPRNGAARGPGSLSGTMGGLSPLSIGKPLTFFSDPDDADFKGLPT